MHVRLKGIHHTPKVLADGTVKVYWYAWRGGPRLQGEPGTPEFIASYNAAVATKVAPTPGTLHAVLAAFQDSSDFTGLRSRSQDDYRWHIARIEAKFATFPVAAFTDPRTRGVFKAWRDELGKRSLRQADYTWMVLCKAVAWGLDNGKVPCHPFTGAGKLYEGTRADKVWSPQDEAHFLTVAPKVLHLPFMLAVWTGQRQGDLLRLSWKAYDGAYIRLKQSKSKRGKEGRRVTIPVGSALKAALDAAPPVAPLVLTRADGRPWTRYAFGAAWRRACAKAGITGLTFHDLRGTAVTRLALAGCTEAEIASITGHSLSDVRSILDANYLHRDPQLAKNAIQKLETRTKLQTGLQTGHEAGQTEREKRRDASSLHRPFRSRRTRLECGGRLSIVPPR
jgi:integrase